MMSSPSTLEKIKFLRSQPLATLVQKEVERQILSNELRSGARLNELEIARNLGVSRAPVRESLRTLEQAGLVISRKNLGVFRLDPLRDPHDHGAAGRRGHGDDRRRDP
jgi:DNA-binding GntR family transcriptional regulator